MPALHQSNLRATIESVLRQMGMYSLSAEVLMLGTAAHESHLGKYLKQIKGPARGPYQMEPDTEKDIWENYLCYRPGRARLITNITGVDTPDDDHLTYNLVYSTAMARLHYRRISEPFPPADNLPAIASYWDRHYNRNPEKGFPAQFINDYRRLVLK